VLDQKIQVSQTITSLLRQQLERMRYAHFRSAGYLIGSGVIESGCKQIVTQRLKLPGAQWHVEGAVLTAKARTAWMSGNWHKLVAARSLLPLAT
jgi:hypothetical protein